MLFEGEDNLIPKSEAFDRWFVAKTEAEALAAAKAKFPEQAASLRVMQVRRPPLGPPRSDCARF